MNEVRYCEKCGWVGHILFSKKCENCKTRMKLLPKELKYKYHIFVEDWSQTSDEEELSRKENFVMGELKDNPLFSMEAYQNQVQKKIESKKRAREYQERRLEEERLKIVRKNLKSIQAESDKQNCIPKCPSCGSANVAKIGVVNRAVSAEIFGLASSKIGKTHKCNNCGTTW